MASDVERIKEKLPIEEVVGAYVKLEKGGGRLKGRCPFHSEKSPSFFVSPERGSYYCFGCGAKGDIFTFVEEFEHLDFLGALKTLAERAGIQLTNQVPENRTEKDALYEILERSTLYYQKQLAERKDIQKYLVDRGMTIATIKAWRIGFAPDDWTALSDALKGKGYNQSLIEKAGLSKPSEKKPGEQYDRFRSRIMFPLFDISGRVIGFSGRIFGDEANAAKYLNSPETALFDKSSFLFGFDKAKLEIKKQEAAILVEGQMDLIMSHQAGVTNTVAVSGTSLTEKHIDMLRRFAKKVILAFDADTAGERASERAWQIALAKDMEVKVVSIQGGKDPADLIKEKPDLWVEALKHELHIIEYQLKKAMIESDPRARNKRIESDVLPYIAALQSPIEQSYFLSIVSLQSGVAEKILAESLARIEVVESLALGKNNAVENIHKANRLDMIERKMAALLVWSKSPEELREKLKIIDDKLIKKLDGIIDLEREALQFEAEASFQNAQNIEREIQELVRNLHEEYLKQSLAETMMELKRAEAAKDQAKLETLLKTCQDISMQLHTLKKQL